MSLLEKVCKRGFVLAKRESDEILRSKQMTDVFISYSSSRDLASVSAGALALIASLQLYPSRHPALRIKEPRTRASPSSRAIIRIAKLPRNAGSRT
jgi:hypothetical protein